MSYHPAVLQSYPPQWFWTGSIAELDSYYETGCWGPSSACPAILVHCGIHQEAPGWASTPAGPSDCSSEAAEQMSGQVCGQVRWWVGQKQKWEELVESAAAGWRI